MFIAVLRHWNSPGELSSEVGLQSTGGDGGADLHRLAGLVGCVSGSRRGQTRRRAGVLPKAADFRARVCEVARIAPAAAAAALHNRLVGIGPAPVEIAQLFGLQVGRRSCGTADGGADDREPCGGAPNAIMPSAHGNRDRACAISFPSLLTDTSYDDHAAETSGEPLGVFIFDLHRDQWWGWRGAG